jgi:hypothetical protein
MLSKTDLVWQPFTSHLIIVPSTVMCDSVPRFVWKITPHRTRIDPSAACSPLTVVLQSPAIGAGCHSE